MTDDSIDGRIGFETDGRTLRIRDALEGEEFPLRFDREPQPRPALPDLFPVPVDRAVSFEAESVSIPSYASVMLRNAHGELVARLDESMDFPRATYFLDVSGVTKAFVRIPDMEVSATGMVDSEAVELTFDRPTTVTVGARSLHTRPEATITVPEDPTALAEAVSVLGSSIKEFTPERSWPTLRGYPPRLRVGDELDIPSPLVTPDTGVEVVVRPTYADVFRLSTLAYYLGARVVVGDAPAIRLDTGYVESLPTEGVALEERVEELLRTWLFLDTLARTDGYFESDRHEYDLVGAELPFYPPNLAELSMSERLMEYLEIDPETVIPYTPAWPTEAVLRPVPEAAELLPHLAHVLAPVRVRGSSEPTADDPVALATSPWSDIGYSTPNAEFVPNPDTDPIPTETAVLTRESYENHLDRSITAPGEISVVVLVGSPERGSAVRHVIADRGIPEDVGSWEVLESPDAEAVSSVFSDVDVDIVQCGLPTKQHRVITAAGDVNLNDLDEAPALTVFEETRNPAIGISTVENGGLSSIIVDESIDIGSFRSLVALLAGGAPTGTSVSLAAIGDTAPTRIVGDPGAVIASNATLTLQVNRILSDSSNAHRIERMSVLSLFARLGVEQRQIFDRFDSTSELSGRGWIDGPTLDSSELLTLLDQDDSIVRLNGRLLLPEDVGTEADIEELARRHLSGDSEPTDRA
ncbi:hypothetical protein [Halorubrum amylolyticum]|uniref:hypothetical protein n=1 Tax=Halorubrum amylolyticum TaxID=2508724 RepID=UPI001008EE72|nr:hypothetical protein [Halorubrum amylolyticum]